MTQQKLEIGKLLLCQTQCARVAFFKQKQPVHCHIQSTCDFFSLWRVSLDGVICSVRNVLENAVVTVHGKDANATHIGSKSSFNVRSAGNTGTGNLSSGTECKQVFRGITTVAGQVQAKSIPRQTGKD